MSEPRKCKRSKQYYINSCKKSCNVMDVGLKGFLLTCNNTAKRATQEAYNIFNEYADLLYGPENASTSSAPPVATEAIDDFEAAIRRELEEAKEQRVTSTRRFQVVDTCTHNCVFVRTTLEHPDELLSKFLADVHTTRVSKTRFILRVFPVLGTCRAVVDKIEKLAEEVLAPYLIDKAGLTYCIVYKVRCNSLSREEILPMVGRVALKLNPEIKVCFDKPDIVVSVDVLQKFCCISVMKDFHLYKKYNVQEMCKVKAEEPVVASEKPEPTLLQPDTNLLVCDVKATDLPESALNVPPSEVDSERNLPTSLETGEGVAQKSMDKIANATNSVISADNETGEKPVEKIENVVAPASGAGEKDLAD